MDNSEVPSSPQPENLDAEVGETEKEVFKTKIVDLMHNPRPVEGYDNVSYTRYRRRDSDFTVDLFMPTTDDVYDDGLHREGNYWVSIKVPYASVTATDVSPNDANS